MKITRRVLLLGLALAPFGACASSGGPAKPAAEPLHLVVLHTNDVHGQLTPGRDGGGLKRLAAEVAALRAELEPEAEVLLLDGGDWFQGTPEGRVEGGGAFLELLSALDYDAMAVGNHELDYGREHLEALLARTRLPAVCANVRDPATGTRVPWGEPYRIVERGGVRIALVGLLTPETPVISHASTRLLAFEDPLAVLARTQAELAGKADLVIPVTHLGVREDERLAEAFGLPLIVGGHSHTALEQGLQAGDTLIVQAGAKAAVLGRVDLWVERTTFTVLCAEARLCELERDGPLDPAFAAAAARLSGQTEAEMGTVVGAFGAPLERKGGVTSASSAGNLLCDLFRERAGTPIALHNKGGIRTSLPAGTATRRDLFELLPFDNTLVVLSVSGEELFEALRRAVELPEHSGIEVSGLVVRLAEPGAPKSRLLAVEVAGTPLDPLGRYRVATNSFLARGGDGYFDADVEVELDTGLVLREIVEGALAERGTLTPAADERFLGPREP
jgi:2',3'-cyclic-nucleotide 2'-phosphodiesterase (5'-nucleotidase family)